MDVTQSLLVTMMFVILLSLGIGNILIGLAASLQHRADLQTHWIPTSWHVLLLLEIFDLFWHSLVILEREDWSFVEFVFLMTGPILLFLATSLMLPQPGAETRGDSWTQYLRAARPFFAVLAIYFVWLIGVDVVLADGGFASLDGLAAAEAGLAVVLAVSRRVRVHGIITGVFWVLILSLVTATAAGAVT